MREPIGVIYKIENTVNGKVFIGRTTNSFRRNYGRHNLANYIHNPHLKEDVLKFGEDNFKIYEELDVAYSMEELEEKKDNYIRKHQSNLPQFGYNRMLDYNRGKLHHNAVKVILLNTMEVFDTLREGANKYNILEQNVYACCQGIQYTAGEYNGERLVWKYLKDVNKDSTKEEIKQIISECQNRTCIYCINTGQSYNTYFQIEKELGIVYGTLMLHLNGSRSHAGTLNGENLCWAFKEEYIHLTEEEKKERIKKAQVGYSNKHNWIIDVKTKKIYQNKTHASVMLDKSRPTIYAWIRKERLMFVEEYEQRFGAIENICDLVVIEGKWRI